MLAALNLVTSNLSLQSNHAQQSDLALLAEEVRNSLFWINNQDYNVNVYNGSTSGVISSILYSLSSTYSNQSNIAFSAQYDYYGNEINTQILHTYSEENTDFPLLFSNANYKEIEDYQRYNVNYHQQILVNPYLGAIKANYFIGNALSSTYAICDQNHIILNTRVNQNQTSNNYEYPILLAFIAQTQNGVQPQDGKNNEVLYTSSMRLNPYNNIIISTNEDDITSDLATTIKKDSDITRFITNQGDYSVNFEGLATRAVCDREGYQIGRKLWLTPDNDNTPAERPLLFASNALRSSTANSRDFIGYCSKIYINTRDGNIIANKFIGVATSAQWADLAENYVTDMDYPIGTLVCFGGQKEITVAINEVNGVISDKPAYLMNSNCKGQPIALIGRVPVLVKGKVNINTASKEELMSINGIGESKALAIIEYRNSTKFTKIEDIMNVSGIGESLYNSIKENITV